jgi:tRNA pseudouridine38-40 synthase
MRYKLIIAYDGTNYSGWQVQANATSISKLIQNALETALRHPTNLTGAGRTDAGVHAKGQTAHFDTDLELNLGSLRISLNALLPKDIRIMDILPVPKDFHARYSASSKVYHYYLHLDPIADPFNNLYRYHILGRFDLNLLQKGTAPLIGTHDFTSFANTKKDKEIDPVRTLQRIDVVEIPGGVRLEFEGTGFLYKMVRNLTGALIEVARKKLEITDLSQILMAKDRTKAPAAAPPHGLFLSEVKYLS